MLGLDVLTGLDGYRSNEMGEVGRGEMAETHSEQLHLWTFKTREMFVLMNHRTLEETNNIQRSRLISNIICLCFSPGI